MVARKLDRDTIADLYCLYRDSKSGNRDITIQFLADKIGISRSRLGKLFKRVNPQTLEINYGASCDRYLDAFVEWQSGSLSLSVLSEKYHTPKSTLYRKFRELISYGL